MTFTIQSNFFIFALLLVVVSLLASMFYHRKFQRSPFRKKERIGLLLLRITTLSVIVLLLFRPSLRWWSKSEIKPEIALVLDNSHSMISGVDSVQTQQELNEFTQLLQAGLSDKFDLSTYTFDSELHDSTTIGYSGFLSNYSSVIDFFSNEQVHSNLVSTVLIGDGIYNRGANPLNGLDAMNIPIFAVAHGDSSVYKDALVKEMFSPEIVFVDRPFSMGVQVQQSALNGRNATLTLFEKGKPIEKRQLVYNRAVDFFEESFEVVPQNTGFIRYTAKITVYDDEANKQNNQMSLTAEVRDNRQKVLMLYSATHPDVGAIRRSLERLGEYDIQLSSLKKWDGNLENVDLLFVHDTNSDPSASSRWANKLKNTSIPSFYVFGEKANSNLLKSYQSSVTLTNQNRRGEKTLALYNLGFSTFTIDNETQNLVSSLPPLSSPYGRWALDQSCSALFFQSVQGVETEFPMWVFRSGKKKEAVLLGEGVWRWPVYDYLLSGSFQRFDSMLESSVLFLLLKENRDHLHVTYQKKIEEYDAIVFEAEVFDDVFAYVSDAELELKITNDQKEEFLFGLLSQGNRYAVDIGRMPPGNYEFAVVAKSKGEVYKKSGQFVVVESTIEDQELKAQFDLMRTLAYKTGGVFFDRNNPESVKSIIDSLEQRYQTNYKQEVHQQEAFLLDEQWILLLLILFLASEWALRKYFGQM